MKLWAGQTISEIGTRISREGIPLTAVIVLSASPVEMSWLIAIGGVAALIAGPLAGTLSDRSHRKPLMIVADLGRALALAAVPWAYFNGWLSIPLLLGVAAVVGALTVLFDVAYPTYVPTLVNPGQLLEANRNLALTISIAEVTGPAFTGLLIKLVTAPVAILVDAASFILSALSIAWIAQPEPAPVPPIQAQGWWREATEGVGFVFAHPLLRPLALRTATVSVAWGFFGTLYVYYAIEVLEMSTVALGIVIALGGVGNLIGALIAPRVTARYPLGKVLIASAVWLGLTSLFIPLASEPGWFSIACLGAAQLFGDVAHPILAINELTLRQKVSPPLMLGRVNACFQLLFKALFPPGAILGGGLAVWIGARQTLLICSLGILASALWLFFSPVRKLRDHQG